MYIIFGLGTIGLMWEEHMPWTTAFSHWPRLGPLLCYDFPHLDPAAIRRFRGNLTALVEYLANTHDLTAAEARDALQDWLAYRTQGVLLKAA